MPKRPNPFGDNSPLQFKNCVHQKDVDMGVNAEENMKKVYERTRSLLFGAAYKGKHTTQATDLISPNNDQEMMDICSGVLLPGQTQLNAKGEICRVVPLSERGMQDDVNNQCNGQHRTLGQSNGYTESNGRTNGFHSISNDINPSNQLQSGVKRQTSRPHDPLAQSCVSCNKCMAPDFRPCQFCDKPVCKDCVRQCFFCRGDFCQVCSTVNYDEPFERPFCLNCHP